MQKEQDPDEQEVTIKLKVWQVKHLLGASRLGIWAEDWCAALWQTAHDSYDTHSGKWMCRIGYIIDQIKSQTGVTEEDTEYGDADELNTIQTLVNAQCIHNKDELDRFFEEQKCHN